jgi:hypothetical protein
MKKIIYGTLLCSVFFICSCNKEESKIEPAEKAGMANFVTPTGESILTDFVANDGKTYSITKYDLGRMKPSSKRGLMTFIPKTSNAQLTKILTNAKLIISGSPFYTTGVYFCDVYKSESIITVPSGSFALFTPLTGASIKGLASYNNTAPEAEGSVASQFGNTYVYTTYSIVPRFNVVAQAIFGPTIPRDLTGNVFSYVEYTP